MYNRIIMWIVSACAYSALPSHEVSSGLLLSLSLSLSLLVIINLYVHVSSLSLLLLLILLLLYINMYCYYASWLLRFPLIITIRYESRHLRARVRPVRLLRVWISKGLTQADSSF